MWDMDAGGGGVYQFKPHVGAVPRLDFDPLDGHKLLSTSYDGSVRRMDVEKGAFEQARRRVCYTRSVIYCCLTARGLRVHFASKR